MDARKKVAGAAAALKVFPLPSVILFPNTSLPLHIFEPRYRALVRDCLASDGVMGLAVLEAGWEDDYYGNPPLGPVCCAGAITQHQELPDGRYLIVLEGISRAVIQGELPARALYREVRAQILEDPPYEGTSEEHLRQAVLELASMLPQVVADAFLHQAAGHGGGALADVIASHVVEDFDTRRAVLEELDVDRRIRRVVGELGAIIAQASAARPHPLMN